MSNTNNIIFKNKGEVFKCSFDIDGATSGDVKVRLCLEFNDNKNMFFHGKMDKQGNCTINIPKLTELDDKQGNLRIEAIVDDTYFNLYECPIELKNSVQMKIKENNTFFNNSSTSSGVRVQFGKLEKEQPIEEEKEPVEEKEELETEEEPVEKNPFKPKKKPEAEETEVKNPVKSKKKPEMEVEELEETFSKPEESKSGWKPVPEEIWRHKKESVEPITPEPSTSDRSGFKSFQDFIATKKNKKIN